MLKRVIESNIFFSPAYSCTHLQTPGSPCTPYPTSVSPSLACLSGRSGMALGSEVNSTEKKDEAGYFIPIAIYYPWAILDNYTCIYRYIVTAFANIIQGFLLIVVEKNVLHKTKLIPNLIKKSDK